MLCETKNSIILGYSNLNSRRDEGLVTNISTVARILGINAKEVERKALNAFIREELRRVRAEKAVILARYGVRDFRELWRKIEEGIVDDTDAHDDIVRLDYLEHKERELERLLEELERNE